MKLVIIAVLAGVSASIGLDELIDSDLMNNARVHAAFENVESAKASRYSAFTNFLPSAESSFRYTYLNEVPYLSFPEELSSMMPPGMGRIEMGKHDNYQADLTIKQPVFAGFAIKSGYNLASLNVDRKKQEERKTRSDIVYEVKESYYNLISLSKAELSAQKTLEGIKSHISDVKNMFEAGLLAKNDLLSAQTAEKEMELAIVRIHHAKILTRANLENLTGINRKNIVVDTVLSFRPLRMTEQEAESIAIASNPDMATVLIGLKATKQSRIMTMGALLPSVGFALVHSFKNPDSDNKADWEPSTSISLCCGI
jgi:outer membrane protein TolC